MKKFFLFKLLILLSINIPVFAAEKIVIAHRGASGYLPEHTLEAKVLAYAQGADYIEQDVVMTQDNELIVLHDLFLDRVSNVDKLFPDRYRQDGHYYVVDFTLAEIRTLQITEGYIKTNEGNTKIYQQRFPIFSSNFKVHTLAEEIELIQGLNATTGGNVGIYTEVKSPWFFKREGKDISSAILSVLKQYDYTSKQDKVFLQTFDFNELVRIKTELLPDYNIDLKLVQLIAENSWKETYEKDKQGIWQPYNFNWMHTEEGMALLSEYADGIGPNLAMIADENSTADQIISRGLVEIAHNHGLLVHAYTFRIEENQTPNYSSSFENLLDIFLKTLSVDGVFTDFPDKAVKQLSTYH